MTTTPLRAPLLAAALTVLWPAAQAASATLFYENGFENGFDPDLTFGCASLQDYPGRFAIVEADPRTGSKSTRVENLGGSAGACTDDQDKHRAEVIYSGEKFRAPFENIEGAELWFGISAKFPDDKPQAIFWQMFKGGTPECPAGKPWMWYIVDGSLHQVRFNYATRTECNVGTPDIGAGSFDIPIGSWVDLVQRVVVSWSGRGILEVWAKPAEEPAYAKVISLRDIDTGYFATGSGVRVKHGLYYGADDQRPTMVAYMDNVRVAQGANGFLTVDPAQDGAPNDPPPPALPGTGAGVLVDDADPRFSATAGWVATSHEQPGGGGYWSSGIHYAPPGDGSEVATFDMGPVSDNGIRLWLWWEQSADRDARAPWVVYDSTGPVASLQVDLQAHGGMWSYTGEFYVTPGPIQVRASNAATGWVVADAVYLEETALPPCGDGTCEPAGESPATCPEDCTPTCRDLDGDGYGSPAADACTYPEPDCNDEDDSVHPTASETCNAVDDNCDGNVDEGACADGAENCDDLTNPAGGTNCQEVTKVPVTVEGCGCMSAPPDAWLALGMLALSILRRRTRQKTRRSPGRLSSWGQDSGIPRTFGLQSGKMN